METRRLQAFIKIVDSGSVSRAADLLNIAQPALSQQLATLEADFKQKLVTRNQHGVKPTQAGLALYRHAQTLLRQLDNAHRDVMRIGSALSGSVSVGLAPYSAGALLPLALLRKVRQQHPDILLQVSQTFGEVYSELIMSSRIHMAVIHGAGPMKGVHYQPLAEERFYLIVNVDDALPGEDDEPIELREVAGLDLLLPPRHNFVRQAVDLAFARIRTEPRVVAEVGSVGTLRDAVADGLGATILPWSIASQITKRGCSLARPIVGPSIQDTVSLCTSDHIPLSDTAEAVRTILLDLAADLMQPSRRAEGVAVSV